MSTTRPAHCWKKLNNSAASNFRELSKKPVHLHISRKNARSRSICVTIPEHDTSHSETLLRNYRIVWRLVLDSRRICGQFDKTKKKLLATHGAYARAAISSRENNLADHKYLAPRTSTTPHLNLKRVKGCYLLTDRAGDVTFPRRVSISSGP